VVIEGTLADVTIRVSDIYCTHNNYFVAKVVMQTLTFYRNIFWLCCATIKMIPNCKHIAWSSWETF